MIPIVYKSTDDNAPVLSGTRGSLINILRKCLVEGYGEKSPAGWTTDFINSNQTIACFRNSQVTGSGVFFSVDEETPANANEATIQGYELMTDYNIGIGNFYSLTQLQKHQKTSAANTSSRPWVLIADERFFYFFNLYDFTAVEAGTIVCFGNLIRDNPDDQYACALLWGKSQLYNSQYGFYYGWFNLYDAGSTYYGASRPLGATSPLQTNLNLLSGGGPISKAPNIAGEGWYTGPAFANDKLWLSRPLLSDPNSNNVRGFLPGFFLPCHHPDTFTHLQEIAIEGRTFLCLKAKALYGSNNGVQKLYFIETGVEWV